MELTVNGETRTLQEPMHVRSLLAELGFEGRPCAVEVNEALVPASSHQAHQLHAGDRIEIVTLVGGG
jgi:sulfur carrier protein